MRAQAKQSPAAGGVAIPDRRDSDRVHSGLTNREDSQRRVLRPRGDPTVAPSRRTNMSERHDHGSEADSEVSHDDLKRKNEDLALKLVSLANSVLGAPSLSSEGRLDEHAILLVQKVAPDVLRDPTERTGAPRRVLDPPGESTIVGFSDRPGKNFSLVQRIFMNLTKAVHLAVNPFSDFSFNSVNVGDGIVFWEKYSTGADVERIGVVHDIVCAPQGFVRIHVTRMYTRAEVDSSFSNKKKAVPENVAILFDRVMDATGNDQKIIPVMRTNSQLVIPRDCVKHTVPLLHSISMYENTAGDGSKTSDESMRFSKTVLYFGFLDIKKWEVHALENVDSDRMHMNMILRCVNVRMRVLPVDMVRDQLQPVRNHVFRSLVNLGAKPDPKESKLTISASFHVFTHIIAGKDLDVRWIEETRSWRATFDNPEQLEVVLGKNWNCVCKTNNTGYVVVDKEILLTYSHNVPGKMEMLLTNVTLVGQGGSGALVIESAQDLQQAQHAELIPRI